MESGEYRAGQDRTGLVPGLAGMGCSSCRTLVAVARSAGNQDTSTTSSTAQPPSLPPELFVARLTGGGRGGEKYPVLTLLIYLLALRPASVIQGLSHTDDQADMAGSRVIIMSCL